jgi:hypothetical protein
MFDNDWYLIENYDTEEYFMDWEYDSQCDGSGYCGLQDIYSPIKIECITITNN